MKTQGVEVPTRVETGYGVTDTLRDTTPPTPGLNTGGSRDPGGTAGVVRRGTGRIGPVHSHPEESSPNHPDPLPTPTTSGTDFGPSPSPCVSVQGPHPHHRQPQTPLQVPPVSFPRGR